MSKVSFYTNKEFKEVYREEKLAKLRWAIFDTTEPVVPDWPDDDQFWRMTVQELMVYLLGAPHLIRTKMRSQVILGAPGLNHPTRLTRTRSRGVEAQ